MTPPKRILCDKGNTVNALVNLTTLIFLLVLVVVGLFALSGCSPSDATPPAQAQVDHVFCQAKLNNWLMRHEELAKPFADRYGSYREYMTEECVK
jgi:hypothetical protein